MIFRYNETKGRGIVKHIFMMKHTKKHHDFECLIHDVMKDYEYEVVYKNSIHDAVKYISNYPQTARFYAVGGDGTLNGLIQAMVYKDHELVLIPLGTGNDFCRTLTKEKKPLQLLKQSLNLPTTKVDTILMNDTYYINAACFGVDSVIANHVHDTPDIPLVPESKSYIVSILQNVFRYHFDKVTIMSEGKCLYQGQVTLCTLNNGQYYGGGFQIIPQADIRDGYIDICIVDKLPKTKIPYMVGLLVAHAIDKRKEVHYFKVKEATVFCENSCNMDGEEIKAELYYFQIQHSSLNLVLYQ